MKKNLFITMSLVLALSLVGCGSTKAEESKTETKQEAVVEDIAPAPTETVPEVVEEEPEVEETSIVEEPEVEDPFAKYDEGEFYGADIYTALDEFAGQPVAVLVTTGRYNYVGANYVADNYNAIIDGAYKDPDTGTYAVLYNDGTYEGDPEIGGSWVLSEKSNEGYFVGKISKETPAYTDESYLHGDNATEENPAPIMGKIEDYETFTSHLIKDDNGNTIGILFKSNYKITLDLEGYSVVLD